MFRMFVRGACVYVRVRVCFGFLLFVGLLRFYFVLFCFVRLRSVYEFYTQNIVVHTACEHTTTDAQQTIRTAQFISSKVLFSVDVVNVLNTCSVCIQTANTDSICIFSKNCRLTYAANAM